MGEVDMSGMNKWIVAHPFCSAVVVALVAAAVTLLMSGLFHPDGFSFGVGKLWLSPVTAILSYLFSFLPMSKSHGKRG
ncbi:hypothetical protein ACL03H_17305 [Saccharopolyspora sp. MS10]|uniref:hypothetical protein n=1 Tax=Saccharopolyspora sp. MS10 TaxID=3385973 RepID=UPI0039A21ED6